jgi:outer membrane immunogenic protein
MSSVFGQICSGSGLATFSTEPTPMHRFRSAALAAVALAGFTSAASAADLPRKAPVIAPPPVVFSWTGFYIGANIGGSIGWDSTDSVVLLSANAPSAGTTNPISSQSYKHSPAGVLGGGQIGYNWQTGNWVLGVEGDWDWANQRDTVSTDNFIASTIVVAPARLSYSDEQKIKWLATARARLGWARDTWLWYVTGGAAWGEVESNYTFQVTGLNAGGATVFATAPAAANSSTTKGGWTVGGVVETSLAWMGVPGNNWSAKLEYLYVDLGTVTNTFTVPLTATPAAFYTFASSSHIRDNIIRVGLNYRFATR